MKTISPSGRKSTDNAIQNLYPEDYTKGQVWILTNLTSKIINAAIEVHRELGPGLFEAVYHKCMIIELESKGLQVQSEVPMPIKYKSRQVSDEGYRIDLLVNDIIVVELKSVEKIKDVHKKQLLTYLRLADKPLGLLINFNEALVKDGITRIINGNI